MEVIGGIIGFVVVTSLLMHFDGFRNRLQDVLLGTYDNGVAGVQTAIIAGGVLALLISIFTFWWVVLFFFAITTQSMVMMVVLLIIASLFGLVIMYAALMAHTLSGQAGRLMIKFGRRMQVPLVLVPDPSTTGWKYGLQYSGLAVVNSPRMVFTGPWNLLMGIVIAFGVIGKGAADYFKWSARLAALINTHFIALAGVGLVQIQTSTELINFATVIVLCLTLIMFLSFGLLADWKLGLTGVPITATLMVIVFVLSIGLFFASRNFPGVTNGLAQISTNSYDSFSNYLNSYGVKTAGTQYPLFQAKTNLYSNKDVFKKVNDGFVAVDSSTEALMVSKGDVCMALNSVVVPDRSTPVPMVQLYCPSVTDPRFVQWKTQKDRYFWIPNDSIESVQTISSPTPTPTPVPATTPTSSPTPGSASQTPTPEATPVVVTPTPNVTVMFAINSASKEWIKICDGDCVLSVTGEIDFGGIKTGPRGVWREGSGVRLATAPNLPFGALIAKKGEKGEPFVVNSGEKIEGGNKNIYVIVNDSIRDDNLGSFLVYKN